jgi:hypothetical protein
MTGDPKTSVITIAPGSSEQAPFIFFDGVAAFGVTHGVIQFELGANIIVPVGTDTRTDVLITAHLRCSPAAAMGLRQAIDKVLQVVDLAAADAGKPN